MSVIISTSTAAKICLAIGLVQAPTVSTLPGVFEAQVRPTHKLTTRTYQTTKNIATATVADDETFDASTRDTTSVEKLIGEIRSWALLDANWDGEGSAKPSAASIKEAVSFAGLIKTTLKSRSRCYLHPATPHYSGTKVNYTQTWSFWETTVLHTSSRKMATSTRE